MYTSSVRMIEPRTRRGARISRSTRGCILWASPRPRRLRKLIRGERSGGVRCGEGSDTASDAEANRSETGEGQGAKSLGPGAIHSSDNVVLCVCVCASGDLSCFGVASMIIKARVHARVRVVEP